MHYRLPKTLDHPIRALGIPIDSLLVFMGIWSTFVMFDIGLYGIPVGVVTASIFGRFRSRSIIRKLVRLLYWYLPSEMNFIKGVRGHERKLICK